METATSFANCVSIFLQISKALRRLVKKGFTHNDLKEDNVCVSVKGSRPVATIIDLGLARPLGTLKIYRQRSNPALLPWVAPELILHTQPCSEASDVYSLAHLMHIVLGLTKRRAHRPSVAALVRWQQAALCPEPNKRPGLDEVIEVLEVLLKEAAAASPPGLSVALGRNSLLYKARKMAAGSRHCSIACGNTGKETNEEH